MNVLIIGGAGFIGTNAAQYFAKQKAKVVLLDNLSRKGTFCNKEFLLKNFKNISFIKADIRDFDKVSQVFKKSKFDLVLHLAAQVAVTSSVTNPREDFDINALGTLNVLEAMRLSKSKAVIIYSSTNKVYGGMEDVKIIKKSNRYAYRDYPQGISEKRNLDFHSPYGCSKGCAEQYVRDYQRIYGLKTIVFRQSCIYGRYQFGIEDQGWIAWFTIATTFGRDVTIYGDGMQVRDVLFMDDLCKAFDLAYRNIAKTNGQAYNIGGGSFQLSLLELLAILEKLSGKKIPVSYGDWRPGDQKVYISDIRKARRDFGFKPAFNAKQGVENLYHWVKENRALFVKAGIIS